LANLSSSPKLNFALTIGMSAVPVLYIILLHGFYGQTLGKMAMKLKVLDISERPITFTQAVVRSLPQLLPVFISASALSNQISPQDDAFTNNIFGIILTASYVLYSLWNLFDIIVCLSSDKKRALHDLIAGTVVVRTNGWSNLQ
ncbi:MAG: RDD family protein, partial [Pyrinomonadaceae bacterium]